MRRASAKVASLAIFSAADWISCGGASGSVSSYSSFARFTASSQNSSADIAAAGAAAPVRVDLASTAGPAFIDGEITALLRGGPSYPRGRSLSFDMPRGRAPMVSSSLR